MTFTEMQEAVNDAKATVNRADTYVAAMAAMIAGRLRTGSIYPSTLRQLKDELRKYNVHTSRWKE